jgi:hypothetical protein
MGQNVPCISTMDGFLRAYLANTIQWAKLVPFVSTPGTILVLDILLETKVECQT